jgi:four helix bundle protein
MLFHHERLEIYQRSIEALDLCDVVLAQLPPGSGHLKDQLNRAATSIVLNVAEGAGEFSRLEKRRFYRMASRSATEAAAILHILERRSDAPGEAVGQARVMLNRVISMLVRMTKVERRA